MPTLDGPVIDLTADPVSRARAADAALWQAPEANTTYLRLRDAAVHEALSQGVAAEEVGRALGVHASDVRRMAHAHTERAAFA